MRFFILSCLLCVAITMVAQVPALIPYQAIARDALGQPLASANINARFTIHDATPTGSAVWQEIQTVSTTALGLFTVQLGSQVPLTAVNWATGSKFMQVEVDLGNGFTDIGTQQMLSVPYALHAGSVRLNTSETGDTLYIGGGDFVIIPGISEANFFGGTTTGTSMHSCGALNVHNPDLVYGSMMDQEGNIYKTIVIGSQEWMAENLKTTIYRNGDYIPNLDNTLWQITTNGAWTYLPQYDESYECPFGKSYNWYAVADARNLCPLGWHVPSHEEWLQLTDYLGGDLIAGGALKSVGTIETNTGYWLSPNFTATNSSGFSAVAGDNGSGGINGNDYTESDFWTSTSWSSDRAWWHTLNYGNSTELDSSVGSYYMFKRTGASVRCLRD
jgi:uncharacterized protein (TIGR02145 family)